MNGRHTITSHLNCIVRACDDLHLSVKDLEFP